jgi:MarR family transcriptional regulator for hemolysin
MCLRAAYLAMRRRFMRRFADGGLTNDQFVVLTVLAGGDGLTQTELVRRSHSDPNTISGILRLLEERGLVERLTCGADGRARRVHLTADGEAAQRAAAAAAETLQAELLAAVPPADRPAVLAGLRAVAAAMAAADPADRPRESVSRPVKPVA